MSDPTEYAAATMMMGQPAFVVGAGAATLVLASGLAFVLMRSGGKKTDARSNDAKAAETKEEVPALDKEKYPGGHLTVYFGSQTGTAESFAQQIEREGDEHGFKVRVVDLEDLADLSGGGDDDDDDFGGVKSGLLAEPYRDDDGTSRAVLLLATYGEGEPTDNATSFVDALKEKAGFQTNILEKELMSSDSMPGEEKKVDAGDDDVIDRSYLRGLDFAVFGLGNRQYEHFNAMGKLVNEALSRVGGNRIATLGLGDDDDDLEQDFETWKDTVLWPALKERYIGDKAVVSAAASTDEHKLPECQYTVEYLPGLDGTEVKPDDTPHEKIHNSSKHYFTAVDCPVKVLRELRSPTDPGSTVHMEIDISNGGDEVKYQTADNLGVLPVNEDKVVDAVASALSLDLNAAFRIGPSPGHESKHAIPFPTPCTVRECLARYCDLTSAPRRSELKLLAAYATDPIDKKALLRMSTKEGKAEYREKIVDGHVGLVDIVSKLCPSIVMPLEHLIAVCPRLHPRYYTISSSSSCHPDSVHITVSVLKTERKDGSIHNGVCSGHLAASNKGQTVRVFSRDSTFRLPKDTKKPVIMVGPGTGIAPMRALLQERSHQSKKRKLSVGTNVLYFGCKDRSQDYIYADELEAFRKDGVLNHLRVAFSREQQKKVYVQHLLAENADETWNLIDKEGASVFVCGGVKMGADVGEALRSIATEKGGMSHDDAKSYLERMAAEGRYVQELWA